MVRAALHTAWEARRPVVLAAPVLLVVGWACGLPVAQAALLMVAIVTIVLVALSIRVPQVPGGFAPIVEDREGTRSDLARISWSFNGNGGRVSEAAIRRLRITAEGRLLRVGVDWHDPAGRARAEQLLGARAWATLTHPGGLLPKLREIEHCLTQLEQLEQLARRAATPAPADVPRPVTGFPA